MKKFDEFVNENNVISMEDFESSKEGYEKPLAEYFEKKYNMNYTMYTIDIEAEPLDRHDSGDVNHVGIWHTLERPYFITGHSEKIGDQSDENICSNLSSAYRELSILIDKISKINLDLKGKIYFDKSDEENGKQSYSIGIYISVEDFYNMDIIKSAKTINKYDL